MEEEKNIQEQPKKVSYEQLEGIAHQLSEQNAQLFRKLQEVNMQNVFARLNYLFRVVELKDRFPNEFLNKCIEEIMSIMTIDTPETEEQEKAE